MTKHFNIFENINFVDDKGNKVIVTVNDTGKLVNSEGTELIRLSTLENYLFVNVISKLQFDEFELSMFRKVFEFEKLKDNKLDVEKAVSIIEKLHTDYFTYSENKRSELLNSIFNNITINKNETIRISYNLKPISSKVLNKVD